MTGAGAPDLPTFARGLSFLDAKVGRRDADIVVAGVPMDWATTNRAGTREGPNALRLASRLLHDGAHPVTGADPRTLDLSDIGNFDVRIGDIAESHRLIEAQAKGLKHLCALGGDHSIALPLLRVLAQVHGPLGLVQFDAHTDTWAANFGQDLAHGTPFFHAIEEGLIDPKRCIQIGIRAPMEKRFMDQARELGISIWPAEDVHIRGVVSAVQAIAEVVGTEPTYLSFDIDGLDPAYAPGTGTPEIGGLHTWQARYLLRGLAEIDFVGMDLVEVSPPHDHAEITALAGATMVWEYLCLQAGRKKAGLGA